MRLTETAVEAWFKVGFPFLFGGTFIEGIQHLRQCRHGMNFPSFSKGLSLRERCWRRRRKASTNFPSFSKGLSLRAEVGPSVHYGCSGFPFLFEGTFIEGDPASVTDRCDRCDFPSFSKGLSLRGQEEDNLSVRVKISLPFRRDFH